MSNTGTGGNTGVGLNQPAPSAMGGRGNGQPRWGNRGGTKEEFDYIKQRTEQAQRASTDPTDRIHTNPFHQSWNLRASAPATTTSRAPTSSEGQAHYSPNHQLRTLGDSNNMATPVRGFTWNKTDIQTPLIKIKQGSGANWKETADTIQASVPRAKMFPSKRTGALKRPTSQLLTITEDQQYTQDLLRHHEGGKPTNQGPTKPTASMLDLADRLTQTSFSSLKLEDIITPTSSEGTTVVVALILDIIHGLLPTATFLQMNNMAYTLMATCSETLLEYLQDGAKLTGFVQAMNNETSLLPPFMESQMSPSVTRNLIPPSQRNRLSQRNLTRNGYIDLIMPFVKRYYASDAAQIERVLRKGTMDLHMVDMISKLGFFSDTWRSCIWKCRFDPPRWVDLHYRDRKEEQQMNTEDMDTAFEDDGECPDILDGFAPLRHMGMPAEEVAKLTPTDQKRQALKQLPIILRQMISTESAAEILIRLATVPDEEFPAYLQPDGFQRCIKDQTTDESHSLPEYRLRVWIRHHEQQKGDKLTNEAIAHKWIDCVQTLSLELNMQLRITTASDSTGISPAEATDEVLQRYIDTPHRGGKGTFDMWVITTCMTWGHHDFEHKNTKAAKQYYDTLAMANIIVTNEEMYLVDLIPCVALVGSERQDKDGDIYAEFKEQLDHLGLDIAFQVIWCRLRDNKREAMMKCIATPLELGGQVITAFARIRQASVTKFYPVTHAMEMYAIPSTENKGTVNLTEIIMSQQTYEDDTVRIALTGLNKKDPHDFHPTDTNGNCSALSMAELILIGGENDSADDDNRHVVTKITADSTLSRCYLTAFKQDAQDLIDFASALVPRFSKWVGGNTEVRVLAGAAEKWVRKDKVPPPTTVISNSGTSSTSALTSSAKTFETTVDKKLDQLTKLILEQNQQIRRLADNNSVTTRDDIVGAIQTSLTSNTAQLQTSISKLHDTHLEAMHTRMDELSTAIGDAVQTHSTQQATATVLMDLIAQYNETAGGMNDCTRAYGQEIALLRVMLDACIHRINWLVEDIGSNHQGKPLPPPSDQRLSTRGLKAIIDAAHDVYKGGETRVDEGTEVAERSIQIVRDQELAAGRPWEDPRSDAGYDDGDTEGRQREPDPPHPPIAPAGPWKRAQTPPLPDTTGLTEQTKEIAIGSDPADGTTKGTMEKTGTTEVSDVQQPTNTTQKQGGDEIEPDIHMNSGAIGTCTCCDKHSDDLQQCASCGQLFHEDCITRSETQGITCTQCIEDQHMIGGQSRTLDATTLADALSTSSIQMSISSNDSSEDSSSTNTGGGSSYSVATPQKKRRISLLKTPQKHSKLSTDPKPSNLGNTLTDTQVHQDTTALSNSISTEDEPNKSKTKSTQSTLTRRPDTGTIQIDKTTPPISRTRPIRAVRSRQL